MTDAGWPPGGDPVRIRLVRVRVPLVRAHRAAHGTESVRDVVLVCWTRPDGVEGWAECSTLSEAGYVTETTDEAWRHLVTRLAPEAVEGRSRPVTGALAASAALLDAALDAELRARGVSLVEELGGTARPLERCVVLASLGEDPESVVAAGRDAINAGAAMVKLKVRGGTEAAALRLAVEELGGDRVAADANGSFSSLAELRAVDSLGLAYLEQPLPAGTTWDELATLRRELDTPVALDESLVSAESVAAALYAGAADVVSVKPLRLGGLRAATSVVTLAAEHGVDVFVGGMLELGIGRAAAAALATLPGCTVPTDLGPSEAYVAVDVCEPVLVDERGRLVVPTGPGCGRLPEVSRLAACAVDEVVIGR